MFDSRKVQWLYFERYGHFTNNLHIDGRAKAVSDLARLDGDLACMAHCLPELDPAFYMDAAVLVFPMGEEALDADLDALKAKKLAFPRGMESARPFLSGPAIFEFLSWAW